MSHCLACSPRQQRNGGNKRKAEKDLKGRTYSDKNDGTSFSPATSAQSGVTVIQ